MPHTPCTGVMTSAASPTPSGTRTGAGLLGASLGPLVGGGVTGGTSLCADCPPHTAGEEREGEREQQEGRPSGGVAVLVNSEDVPPHV